MENKKKFVLEFDEVPSFIYVSENEEVEHIYLNGHKVKFWHSLKVKSNMEQPTEYQIKGYSV